MDHFRRSECERGRERERQRERERVRERQRDRGREVERQRDRERERLSETDCLGPVVVSITPGASWPWVLKITPHLNPRSFRTVAGCFKSAFRF